MDGLQAFSQPQSPFDLSPVYGSTATLRQLLASSRVADIADTLGPSKGLGSRHSGGGYNNLVGGSRSK